MFNDDIRIGDLSTVQLYERHLPFDGEFLELVVDVLKRNYCFRRKRKAFTVNGISAMRSHVSSLSDQGDIWGITLQIKKIEKQD